MRRCVPSILIVQMFESAPSRLLSKAIVPLRDRVGWFAFGTSRFAPLPSGRAIQMLQPSLLQRVNATQRRSKSAACP